MIDRFHDEVDTWMLACFGEDIPFDKVERNHRFIEEALELVQAFNMPKADALALVEYVYGRPVGEPIQEVGDVMVTLAALCSAQDFNLSTAAMMEIDRVQGKIDEIRAKQAAKPKFSALPM